MDPNTPLHPNLARIAAEYDELCDLYASGRIEAGEARRSIAALAARDDNGTIWSIDPTTGDWVYRDVHGRLIPATPPAWGYATPTAYDVTRDPARHDPRHRVVAFTVDPSIVSPPGQLTGSTRTRPAAPSGHRRWLIAAVVALVAVAAWALLGRGGDDPVAPVPATDTTAAPSA